ncbi:MAG: DUF3313 domain-containing protein [Planctomycetes bacterium]|nr:DUF3313 domain-containing protein [Planctomycetota bacterium]
MGTIFILARRFHLAAAVIAALLLFAGCTTPPQPSGFLGDYSELKAVDFDPSQLWYIKPGVNWAGYTKMVIERPVLYYSIDAEYRHIEPEELNMLAGRFAEVLREKMAGQFELTDKPGPGVLVMRPALTEIKPAKRLLNAASLIVAHTTLSTGGACAETEFADSVTNERLAAMMDHKLGDSINPVKGLMKWDQVIGAFRQFAGDLMDGLNKASGRPTRSMIQKTVDKIKS